MKTRQFRFVPGAKVKKRAVFGMVFLFAGIMSALAQQDGDQRKRESKMLADNVFHLSEVMLHDVANPPAASRFYAYCTLGAYEVARCSGSKLPDLDGRFNVNPGIKAPPVPKKFNLAFSANYALLEVGRQIMPSGYMLEEKQKELVDAFKASGVLSERNLNKNIRYAQELARQVLAYAKTDGYGKLSTYKRYTPPQRRGALVPDAAGILPAGRTQMGNDQALFPGIRRSVSACPAHPFSKDTTSSFYGAMMEVYNVVNNLTAEQKEIASFWDCNPFAVTYSGHMAIGLKKISPGGHWMGITGIVCQDAGIPLDSAIFAHALVAVTLHDAFISCWQEKYHSDRIRPETAINKMVDPKWRPILQTPPFPEYTSGHSVASASAASALTRLFGDHFRYTDTSELYFGLPERKYNSFFEASGEAAISRLYGGIHYRDACEEGVRQGRDVGAWVLKKVFGPDAKGD
ncbi:MAG: vanadium-dependent haloperoxidase [Lewinellaceae bacterium]|nr:vanadium-dependent haloperoxidase [Lewinellaceae bacterium]